MELKLRIADGLFVLAALALLGGILAIFLAAGWQEGPFAFAWYLQQGWPHGLQLLMGIVPATVAVAAAAGHTLVRARRGEAAVPAKHARAAAAVRAPGHLVQDAQRFFATELGGAQPRLERVLDALLGAPVDLGVAQLLVEPAPPFAKACLLLEGEAHHVADLPGVLYEQVLARMRLMIGCGAAGEGVVKLISSTRIDQLRIVLRMDERGVRAEITVLGAGAALQSSAVVFRLEPKQTGEKLLLPLDDHDEVDRSSGPFAALASSAEEAVAGMARPRRVAATAAWLRLGAAIVIAAALLTFFAKAYYWGGRTLVSGSEALPWREVAIAVQAAPVAGEVIVQGQPRGNSPLVTRVPCRGQPIEVLVRARGYAIWQWSGLCPEQGALYLEAELKSLRAGF